MRIPFKSGVLPLKERVLPSTYRDGRTSSPRSASSPSHPNSRSEASPSSSDPLSATSPRFLFVFGGATDTLAKAACGGGPPKLSSRSISTKPCCRCCQPFRPPWSLLLLFQSRWKIKNKGPGRTCSILKPTTFPIPSKRVLLALSTPANRATPLTANERCPDASDEQAGSQSRKRTIRLCRTPSQRSLVMEGCRTARASSRILVVVWLINSTAMFLVAANFSRVVIRESITAERRLRAQCAAALFLGFGCGSFIACAEGLGKASWIGVEILSMIRRLVFGGGNWGSEWVSNARRWERVGVVK